SFFNALKLGLKVELDSDRWEYSEEPHVSRRREILAKYPQIKQLMGSDPWIAVIVTCEVAVQLGFCHVIRVTQPNWAVLLLVAYAVGATLNHSLGSAIHEIGHNLAFGHKRPWANRLLAIFCNLPIAIPMAISYKKYHTDHHRWLGHEDNDVDIPTKTEARLFRHPLTKLLWLCAHPFIHGLRPFIKSPKPTTPWELFNFTVCMTFDLSIYVLFGWKSLCYLIVGTLFGFGPHPLAGHFISEHYLFSGGQSTHSYYGPLNVLLFNVGYHIEHHDFPYIPYRRLPEVRRIAGEYYNSLPHHTSWLRVLWDFITKDQLGPHARGVNNSNCTRPELYEAVQKDMARRIELVATSNREKSKAYELDS
uniref:sphingolipid 4-desaturase n=1 Tax=Macrostomum lignano TaxID=282301 RepID=A0A1I8HSY5_9PLAT